MFDYFKDSPKDIIAHLRPLFQRGVACVRDGKVLINGEDSWDVPWIYITPEGGIEEEHNCRAICFMCAEIKFKGWSFIPIRCHSCWKVVVRPRTLKELFALHELQKEMGLWSKTGIEDRPKIPAVYGGYFYNDTLDKARQCKVVVEKRIAADISPDIPIYIKRGCTEYEEKFPEPRHWKIPPKQKEFEAYLDDRIILKARKAMQPDFVALNVKRKWVERAFELGQEYRTFTGGRELHELTTTY